MEQHANTLFVTTQGAYLARDHQTLRVRVEKTNRLQVPLHHLEGIVCFGRVGVSHGVYKALAERSFELSFFTEHGQFLARAVAPTSGNVFLRRTQYRLADDPASCLQLARPMIAAKVQNARNTLLRAARDNASSEDAETLRRAAAHLAAVLEGLAAAPDLNTARGIEGETARVYFECFSAMVRQHRDFFQMRGRSRRPPRDAVNALLSFIYALVRHDCAGALQGVGLDPAVGYLHADRPGRLSLALDLMEEFRTLIADRLALTLINRRQVLPDGFSTDAGGAVSLDEKTRRAVLVAYQERKREKVQHPVLDEQVTIGLLPHLQARLLARTLRGDVAEYPALVLR
jgi:CRISPR-associated protein Cas1